MNCAGRGRPRNTSTTSGPAEAVTVEVAGGHKGESQCALIMLVWIERSQG